MVFAVESCVVNDVSLPLYLICCMLLNIHSYSCGYIQAGYQDIAEMLLRMGGDLAAVDNAGNSTLHYAVKGGHFPTIEWLIQNVGLIVIRCAC